MIDAEARIAELIRENLMRRSKLAKHGLQPPACKPLRRRSGLTNR